MKVNNGGYIRPLSLPRISGYDRRAESFEKAVEDTKSYTADQLLLLARTASFFSEYRWFPQIEPPPDSHMTALLINVYTFSKVGEPLHKKAAWKKMGLEDIKTGRKYITHAIKLGLIESRRSSEDKRRELLLPTESLKNAVEQELHTFGELLRHFMWDLLDTPLPETGSATLLRGRGAVRADRTHTTGSIIQNRIGQLKQDAVRANYDSLPTATGRRAGIAKGSASKRTRKK